ncbi:hypothetical protein K525DRAFT_275335 [Schizophyllum commune Loenen D]|nr:hypothetical protein K525DRAFT_275335 [Schizophyllum commune Loenen D]
MSRPTPRLNKLAAIDKLTLARHVADFPKTRQTRQTSPSTPRPTTGSSSQWADAEGSGLARRAAPAVARSCRGRFPTRPRGNSSLKAATQGEGGVRREAARSAAGDTGNAKPSSSASPSHELRKSTSIETRAAPWDLAECRGWRGRGRGRRFAPLSLSTIHESFPTLPKAKNSAN